MGVGSLLGVTGAGVDNTAAEEIEGAAGGGCNRPDEVVHLDYGAYESWEDIYWMSNGDRENLSIVSSPTYAGDTALQLRVRDGEHWGLSTHYSFDDGLLELNGRVAFALNTSWTMGNESEHCRIWNCAMSLGEGSASGGVPDGTNGWSNRLYVSTKETDPDGPFHLLSYTYHMDQNQDHDYLLQQEPYAVRQPEIVPGRWYELEYYVCMNTIDDDGVANSDGVIQYWLDGDLIYDRRDLRFTEDHETNIIETNGPAGYYGGRYVAPQNLYSYYANHSMALNGTFGEGC
ncbi:hypothetical protein C477_02789 [Haloterrigena salina JCM 13891]|uniref:Polysaccharide lyase n=1 Tax=Haloterrigena salina JCM 13891 TaxID=1227488 RepID=M0CM36_9EURY|nr:hypothetical protein [Haloterrigena salina]ELZ23437.1 hypothetical protein C477_02789 [Haloterrigena salina JCM 13891]